MKYTIHGFSQEKLIDLGLDYVDAAILRYFIDFRETKKMTTKIINGEPYYWVKYESILEEYPILNIKTKDSMYRRLKKLEEARVLKHVTIRSNGTYSYYTTAENYLELVSKIETDRNPSQTDNNPNETDRNPNHTDEKHTEVGLKVGTNNPSTISINNNNVENKNLDDNVKKIIEYLNAKTNKNFKTNTQATIKLIKARLKEGFTSEDFERVINNMNTEWTGTQWEKYLVPTTLFAGKFETYLNQGKNEKKKLSLESKEPIKPLEIIWGEM